MNAYHHTKQYGSKDELLVLKDNLDDQVQKQYQYVCQEGYITLFCYYNPEYTDDLDTPDADVGNQIRFCFGVYIDDQFWDYGNVKIWYLGLLPASH